MSVDAMIANLRAELVEPAMGIRTRKEKLIVLLGELDKARAERDRANALLRDIRYACPQYGTGEWKARFAAIDAHLRGEGAGR